MKRVLILSFMLNFCIFGFSQENLDTEDYKVEKENNETQKQTAPHDETKILLNNPEQQKKSLVPIEKNSFFADLWKFVLTLILICVLAYVVLRLLKKSNAINLNDDPYLKVASSLKLAQNKFLYIIMLKQEAFLIAVTEKDVSLISKIDDQELIDTLNLNLENRSVEPKSFAETLATIFKKTETQNTEKAGAEDAEKPLTENFLAGMHDRLNKVSETSSGENED